MTFTKKDRAMKEKRKTFKGIEYVVFDELPCEQQSILLLTFSRSQFINILVDGKVIRNCIAYCSYSDWYEEVYQASRGDGKNQPERDGRIRRTAAMEF